MAAAESNHLQATIDCVGDYKIAGEVMSHKSGIILLVIGCIFAAESVQKAGRTVR